MWILEGALIWIVVSILTGIGWGVFVSGGFRPYWRGIREVFAPSNVSEHGDLSEGR